MTTQEIITNDARQWEENWTDVTEDFREKIEKVIYGCVDSNLKINYVAKVEGTDYYVVSLWGGKNGSGKWNEYLLDLISVFNSFITPARGDCKDAWMVELKNDCADDVFTVIIGFKV